MNTENIETKKPAKNKLYNLSYFRKRLHDAGLETALILSFKDDKVITKKVAGEKRQWIILVESQVLITCYKVSEENVVKDFWFTYSDGKNKISFDVTKRTNSMNTIITSIKEIVGIIESN